MNNRRRLTDTELKYSKFGVQAGVGSVEVAPLLVSDSLALVC